MTTHEDHQATLDGSWRDLLKDLRSPTVRLRRRIDDVYQGFYALHEASVADGVVSSKCKELVALALAVNEHCEGCIAYHARAAARKGATEQEVAEVLGVTLLFNAGPAASDYAPKALQAFVEFADDEQLAEER
jgi:AhpD family alkylhydroperoxidase